MLYCAVLSFPPMSSISLAFFLTNHYENLSMQYTEIFFLFKKKKISLKKKKDVFLIFAQNIDCGYTLEPPRRGGSNEYPQSMF